MGSVLSETVEKPPVRLGHDSERGEPSARGIGKQAHGGLMMAIRTIEERDEDAAVAEDRSRLHGRGRSYTTSLTRELESGFPEATIPAWRIQGRFARRRSPSERATARRTNSATETPNRRASSFAA